MMNHAVSWRIYVNYCLLDTQAQHTFSNPPSINCLCCSLQKNRQVSTVPSPQKKDDPLSQGAGWCPLTPFLSQVSTGLDLVELSETGQWLTTEVLDKGRGPTSIQDRFEAVWLREMSNEKRPTLVGCLGDFLGGG